MTNKANDNKSAELEKRLKAIVNYVRECQARVTKGEILSLQGLDDKVVKLCDEISTLSENEGRILESQMSLLIESLEVLASGMKEQQEGFAGRGDK
ncbi:MAG: hypothetical protein KAS59_08755 [Alphaproteobacteria bacterium]|nr:hypothetical protein [Alphaproteobacteria bacterium]MCK5555910.1 hypothetical protein [Alphaproteobacteria bacterium]